MTLAEPAKSKTVFAIATDNSTAPDGTLLARG